MTYKLFPGSSISKAFSKTIMHSSNVCKREVGRGQIRKGLKPQLKYLPDGSWDGPLYCEGPSGPKGTEPFLKQSWVGAWRYWS